MKKKNHKRPTGKHNSPKKKFYKKKNKEEKAGPVLKKEVAKEMVLNKYLASTGICSRRKAAEFIEAGKVKVNGEIMKVPYYRVQENDVVEYDGKTVTPEEKLVYLLINKPKNTITSTKDPQGRKTVMDIVANACTERIFPVGRLDRDTLGLLLLTNDGDLAKKLSHPSHGVEKIYHVVLDQQVEMAHMKQILAGLELEDGVAEVDALGYIEDTKGNEVGIKIHIGKNRIVRRLFEHFGYKVVKLDRVLYGGLTKKDLPRGKWRHLTKQEIIQLKHFK